MAFKKTSGTIVIDATLTEIGREKMAKGEFIISKFGLGDDEIDYELYNKEIKFDEEVLQAPEILPILEAYSNKTRNINYGPVTHINQEIMFSPELKINDRLDITPNIHNDVYYISVNDETSEKLNFIFSNKLRFLETNSSDKTKLIIESGLNTLELWPNVENRNLYLLNTGLLDQYFYVLCDYRFIDSILASSAESKFKNFPNGDSIVNFETLEASPPTSHENKFKYHRTHLCNGVANMMSDYGSYSSPSLEFSSLLGPRGTIIALNFVVNSVLKSTSEGTRDARWNKYGYHDQILFGTVSGVEYKFDYIETTIYIIGAVSHARIQVPVRLLRYAGT